MSGVIDRVFSSFLGITLHYVACITVLSEKPFTNSSENGRVLLLCCCFFSFPGRSLFYFVHFMK